MTFSAKILADSISTFGVRLTSFEITFPRPILAELNTHRDLSRNSASSRAIPVEKLLKMVKENPYVPSHWGKNQKGMQAGEPVSEAQQLEARVAWLDAAAEARGKAQWLLNIGIHKQITNRLLEPFLWHTAIVTATEWSNFFNLRNNVLAHPDFHKIASMMQELYESASPKLLTPGQWHLPLVYTEDLQEVFRQSSDFMPNPFSSEDDITSLPLEDYDKHLETLCKISVGRCARVSYLTHDGQRDHQADINLHDELLKNGHLSPFEHVARPATPNDEPLCSARMSDIRYFGDAGSFAVDPEVQRFGNLRGWVQYRKLIPGESDILGYLKKGSV